VTEMIVEAMTRPDSNGTPSLPKRSAPKGLLPSTWMERTLKLEYVDAFGSGVQTSGTLLDVYPSGPIFSLNGAKTLISWDRLALAELVED
jgi:hypothetical protein